MAKLKRISSVSILGSDYDLARNGDHFHLVEHKEPDAYDRPVAREVNLQSWMECDRLQALLDLYGESLTKIVALEEEVTRAHSALQREAGGPDTTRRPTVARESVSGMPGILDPKPEE